MSREYTEDEVREMFLRNVWNILNYWKNESRAETLDEKMEGFAFSFLVMLDGGSGNSPGFIVAPSAHEDDKEYNISEGENYYPQNHESDVKCDIAGYLHEIFKDYKSK